MKHPVILGDEAFVAKFRDPDRQEQLSEIPKNQRRPLSGELAMYRANDPRDEAMARAYLSGAYTIKGGW